MASLIGRTLGGYEILEELGRGAMGVVFKARQLSMDRVVALKFLPNRLAQNEKIVARFLREARAAGKLSHPNIVSVHDAGVIEGLHFIAMEFVDGNSVQKRMREKGEFNEKDTLDITAQIAEALKMAHSQGVLHRDIKPDNFLIDSAGRVRLADLGLAHFESADDKESHLTEHGTALGTPHYMSPEQCKGDTADARSDIYSLGVSMYVMATNKTPYEAQTGAAVMVKVITEQPRSLKLLNPNLSPSFIALVEKMMHKDIAKRFSNATQVLEAIELCRQNKFVSAGHRSKRGAEKTGSSKMLYGAAALIIAGITAAIALRPIPLKNLSTADQQSALPVAPSSESPPSAVINPDPNVPVAAAPENTSTPEAEPGDTAGPAEKDHPPEVRAAIHAWRALRLEYSDKLKRNPREVLEKAQEFVQAHPYPRVKFISRQFLEEASTAAAQFDKDWQDATEKAKLELAGGRRTGALAALLKFQKQYPETPESADALKQIDEIAANVRIDADKAAAAGNFADAQALLSPAIARLPENLAAPLKADLERITAAQRQADALVEIDSKRMLVLSEQAAMQSRDSSVTTGKRYDFALAARTLREGIASLRTNSAKADIQSLAALYSRAGEIFEKLRNKATELPKLGKFSEGQLLTWEDKGLTYKPAGLPQQMVPWKSVTGEDLIQIAQALRISSGTSASHLFDIGSLAFASGASSIALEKLEEASRLDEAIRAQADFPLRLLKPAATPSGSESQAEQIFNDALLAKDKKDGEALQKLMQRLIVDFADTKFVKSHLNQIDELGQPSVQASDESKALVQSEKPGEIPKEPSAPSVAREDSPAAAELKKAGWEDVRGDWQLDPKRKNSYAVTGRTVLAAPIRDGIVQVRFELEEGAKIGIYMRHQTESELPQMLRNKLEEMGIAIGPGYGVQVDGNSVTLYGDKPPGGIPEALKLKLDRNNVPLKVGAIKLPPGPRSVQLSIKGDKLEIFIDNRSMVRSQTKLRNEGPAMIIIEGSAKIETPSLGL